MAKPHRQGPDAERLERYTRAFRSRRWLKSRKREAGFPWGEIVTSILTGVMGYLAAPSAEQVLNVIIGIASAVVGILIWHVGIAPIGRYIWAVPEEEHVALQERIHELEAIKTGLENERDAVVARKETINGQLLAKVDEAKRLSERLAELDKASEFDLEVSFDGYYATAQDKEDQGKGWWIVYHGVVITNRTDRQLPLQLWLMTGNLAGSWRYGAAPDTSAPEWALATAEGQARLDKVINVAARSSLVGCCAARLEGRILRDSMVSDYKELVETRPFWLEIRNNMTGQMRAYSLNFIARRIDRGLPGLET